MFGIDGRVAFTVVGCWGVETRSVLDGRDEMESRVPATGFGLAWSDENAGLGSSLGAGEGRTFVGTLCSKSMLA